MGYSELCLLSTRHFNAVQHIVRPPWQSVSYVSSCVVVRKRRTNVACTWSRWWYLIYRPWSLLWATSRWAKGTSFETYIKIAMLQLGGWCIVSAILCTKNQLVDNWNHLSVVHLQILTVDRIEHVLNKFYEGVLDVCWKWSNVMYLMVCSVERDTVNSTFRYVYEGPPSLSCDDS